MTAPRVRADYDQLAQVARQFATQAEGASRMLQSVRQSMQVLEDGDWIGRGASSFYQEMNAQVLPTLNRLQRALQAAQRVTQQIRTIIKGAEDEAASYLRGDGRAGAGASGPAATGSFAGAGASLRGMAGVGASGSTNAGGGGLLDRAFNAVRDVVGPAMMGPSSFILDGIGRMTGAGDIGSEMGRGMFDEAVDMGRGLWHMAANRDATIEGLARGIANPSLLWEGFTRPYVEAWESGHPWQAVGRGVFAVGTLFIGAGEAGAAGRAGEMAAATGRTAEVLAAGGRTTEVLAAAGRTSEVLGAGGRTAEVLAAPGRAGELGDVARVVGTTEDTSAAARAASIMEQAPRGPEVFAELGEELGMAGGGPRRSGLAGAVQDAQDAGFMRGIGPGTVDLAVQPHGSAPLVRQLLGLTGAEAESAHLSATAAVRELPAYSRQEALTTLLDRPIHRTMDPIWMRESRALVSQGVTQQTAGELYQMMARSIQGTPGLTPATRGAMQWRVYQELFSELGLEWTTMTRVPYS